MKNVYPKAMSDCGQDLRLGDKMQAVVVVYKFKKNYIHIMAALKWTFPILLTMAISYSNLVLI